MLTEGREKELTLPGKKLLDIYIMAMVPDYRMNLVVPGRVPDEELDAFSTDVGLAR